MVRNIVGVLLAIGEGRAAPAWAEAVLHSRDRRQGGVTAPAAGLYFTGAVYAPQYALPALPPACRFW